MNFLGCKLNGHFQGEAVSELSSFAYRPIDGSRAKLRVKQNWLKMYDKAGLLLRIETMINSSCTMASSAATRDHAVQEPDDRRALIARIHQPGYPRTADVHADAALLRRRSDEGKCQGRPVLQAPPCPQPDRQDCAHTPLARDQLGLQRHAHFDAPARATLPQRRLRRCARNIVARNKEVAAKESVHQRALALKLKIHRRTSWHMVRVDAQACGAGSPACAMMAHEPT